MNNNPALLYREDSIESKEQCYCVESYSKPLNHEHVRIFFPSGKTSSLEVLLQSSKPLLANASMRRRGNHLYYILFLLDAQESMCGQRH